MEQEWGASAAARCCARFNHHLPQQNRRDLDEVPKEPFKDIRFVFVKTCGRFSARR